MEERRDAEAAAGGQGTGLMQAMLNAMGQDHTWKRQGGWQLLSVAIDSGAAETVIPHTLITSYPVEETEKSRAGVTYASATGDPIPNLGQQMLPMATAEGSLRMMAFQATPVAKALGSVWKICKQGHAVVFDDEGSYIYNKTSGEVNWLREEDGNYMLDVWIPPREAMGQDFGRQP